MYINGVITIPRGNHGYPNILLLHTRHAASSSRTFPLSSNHTHLHIPGSRNGRRPAKTHASSILALCECPGNQRAPFMHYGFPSFCLLSRYFWTLSFASRHFSVVKSLTLSNTGLRVAAWYAPITLPINPPKHNSIIFRMSQLDLIYKNALKKLSRNP